MNKISLIIVCGVSGLVLSQAAPAMDFEYEEWKNPTKNPAQQWIVVREQFKESWKKDPQNAEFFLNQLHELGKKVPAAQKWIELSPEVLEYGFQRLKINQSSSQTLEPQGHLSSLKEEMKSFIDPEQQWIEARDHFLVNCKKDPQIAQIYYSELITLAKNVPPAQNWIKYSKEFLDFGSKEPKVIEPVIQSNNNKKQVLTPQEAVQFHKDFTGLRDQLKPMLSMLQNLPKNGDVHLMDEFCVANIPTLITISKSIFPENGTLSLSQIKENLKTLIEHNSHVLNKYEYEKKKFDKTKMFLYIDQAYQDDMPVELCSHAYELSILLLTSPQKLSTFGFHRIFDAIVENYETEGGCFEGRRNRQFGALVSMLAFCGLYKD